MQTSGDEQRGRVYDAGSWTAAAGVGGKREALIATALDGTVTSWNPAAEHIYRRRSEHAVGLPVSAAVGADLDPGEILANGGVHRTTHSSADGSPLPVQVSVAAMENGYVLVCSDQTGPDDAERHFQAIVNALDDGVVVLSRQGRVESINPAALEILGLGPDTPMSDAFRHAAKYPVYDADGRSLPPDQRPLF